ncbi:Chitin binding domain [Sergentomyia squamirostris]
MPTLLMLQLPRPSASLIARRAGATQYAEHLESSSEERKRHGISKRLVAGEEGGEFDAYQGVLGRAGIDFPVLPGIPKTTFNCKSVGNGYFADLETSCQVFHICDDGRKISFLCPNGTIFRQTDLICDWWFKVNCAASPSQYAESAEILARSQNRRASTTPARLQALAETEVRNDTESDLTKGGDLQVAKVPVASRKSYKESSRVRTGPTKLRSRQYASFEYSSQQDGSNESYDFEDFIVPRRRPNYRTRVPVRLVSHPDFDHIYRINYRGPPLTFRVDPASKESQEFAESASFLKTRNTFNGYNYQQPEKRVKLNNGESEITTLPANQPTDTTIPTPVPRRGTAVYSTANSIIDEGKYTTQPPIDNRKINKYTTARRLESSRTTPYYTPTVPTVSSRSLFDSARQVSTVTPLSPTTTTSPPISLQQNPIHVPEAETEREHAMEMMKTLQELDLVTSTPTIPTPAETEKTNVGQRLGLQIPPSSGPETLHSLALYFATAMDNLQRNITTERAARTSEITTEEPETATDPRGIIGAYLRNETVNNYEKLFQPPQPEITTLPPTTEFPDITTPDLLSRIASIPLTENNDLEGQHSKNPVISAAGTQQIRELAQVFTHALSAYLHDPVMFRKVLSEIRPTEPPPPSVETNEVVSNRFGRTENFDRKENQISTNGVTYLPTTPSTTTTTEDLEVLDFSDVTIAAKRDFTNQPLTPASVNPTATTTTPKPELPTYNLNKTPGSNLVSENLERSASRYYQSRGNDEDNEIPTTTENQLAAEINGELTISTIYPYLAVDSHENEPNFTLDENSYFPVDSGEAKRNTSSKPYGYDVISQLRVENLVTSTTAPVPANRFGSEFTTDASFSTTIPVTLSSDLAPPKNGSQQKPSILILPPPKLEDEENLQRAQSQSFVAPGNQIQVDRKGKAFPSSTEASVSTTIAFESTTPEPRFDFSHNSGESVSTTFAPLAQVKGHYITKALPETTTPGSTAEVATTTDFPDVGKFSPNPWSTLAYTIFLDPLTINDGLMNSGEEESTAVNAQLVNGIPRTTVPYTGELTTEATSTKFGLRNSFDDVQTPRNETTDTKDAMKRRANEMFGGLNETSVNSLMNVMKKADSNKTVRRLILLLIQTCDEDYTKTVEESRKALLDALIGMDHNDIEDNIQILSTSQLRGRGSRKIRLQTSNGNNVILDSSTSSVPITTYRRVVQAETTSTTSTTTTKPTTTSTEAPETTTILPETTTDRERTKFISGRFQADEAISAETLSTFDDFGKRTTPLQSATSTTTEEPTTIFPIYYHSSETTTLPPLVETLPPSSTAARTTTARTLPQRVYISKDEATKRVGKSLEQLLGQMSNDTVQHKRSDERALELLKSLYSLAAKWGRR